MARLDRLGPAKEIAQIGAAIGREFSHPLLAAMARKSDVNSIGARRVSLKQVCCFGRACLRMRPIFSNTHWCRMRHTALFCAIRVVHFTRALRRRLKITSPRLLKTSLKCLRDTLLRRG